MAAKIDPIPERNLLSFPVRGPETAIIFQFLVNKGETSEDELILSFANTRKPGEEQKSELLEGALDFLRKIGLVHRITNEEGTKVFIVEEKINVSVPFPLLLIERLHFLEEQKNPFVLAHQILVLKDVEYLSREEMLRTLERSTERNIYAWNEEKLRNWESIATYIGLIRPLKSDSYNFMISPTTDLLSKLFFVYQAQMDPQSSAENMLQNLSRIPAAEWIDFIEWNYFQCRTERKGIHQGLAKSLLSMEKLNKVNLSMGSDASSTILLCDRSVSHFHFVQTVG